MMVVWVDCLGVIADVVSVPRELYGLYRGFRHSVRYGTGCTQGSDSREEYRNAEGGRPHEEVRKDACIREDLRLQMA